jgi:short-subunit dehydrogenase
MNQPFNRRPVILITGASTGVGLALGKLCLQEDKYHVILTARESSLARFEAEGLSPSEFLWIRPLDILSKRQRDRLIQDIERELGGVDILVNNAAYMLSAVVEHVGEEERLQQMDTNFRAPLSLIRGVLPAMRSKGAGKIINISSVGGMMAMPTMSIYSASKFALEGASEALWYEVKPWNIKVTLVQPGFINSDGFQKVLRSKDSLKALGFPHTDYYYQYTSMASFISKIMQSTKSTPNSVAKRVLKVIKAKNPPLRVAGTRDALIFGLARRLLPRSLYHTLFWYLLPPLVRKAAPTLYAQRKRIRDRRMSKQVSSLQGETLTPSTYEAPNAQSRELIPKA